MAHYDLIVSGQHITLDGSTVVDAIDKADGNSICRAAKIGNAAGWQIDRVWLDLGGLHIVSRGSDLLVNYDPMADKPKETVLSISPVDVDDLPHEFKALPERPAFDLFCGDLSAYDDSFRLGVAVAICEEIAENNSRMPSPITVPARFPNLLKINPQQYMALCQHDMMRCHPKGTKEVDMMLDVLTDILANIDYVKAKGGLLFLSGVACTSSFFRRQNKITELEFYRKKAKLTQQQLADAVGMSTRQIQNYEKANSALGDAKFSAIEKIADVLGITTSEIVSDGMAVLVSPQ